jgi:hypothetical protein
MFEELILCKVDEAAVKANQRKVKNQPPNLIDYLGRYPSFLVGLGEKAFGSPIYHVHSHYLHNRGQTGINHINLRLKTAYAAEGAVKLAPTGDLFSTKHILLIPTAARNDTEKQTMYETYREQLKTMLRSLHFPLCTSNRFDANSLRSSWLLTLTVTFFKFIAMPKTMDGLNSSAQVVHFCTLVHLSSRMKYLHRLFPQPHLCSELWEDYLQVPILFHPRIAYVSRYEDFIQELVSTPLVETEKVVMIPIACTSFHDLCSWAAIAGSYKTNTSRQGSNIFLAFGDSEFIIPSFLLPPPLGADR